MVSKFADFDKPTTVRLARSELLKNLEDFRTDDMQREMKLRQDDGTISTRLSENSERQRTTATTTTTATNAAPITKRLHNQDLPENLESFELNEDDSRRVFFALVALGLFATWHDLLWLWSSYCTVATVCDLVFHWCFGSDTANQKAEVSKCHCERCT